MTAVVGFRCWDGVVLCADRQITSPGFFKYKAPKLTSTLDIQWSLAFAYAGTASIAEEAREKILKIVNKPWEKLGIDTVFNAADEVLTGMGRLYTEVGFQMFIALAPVGQPAELMKFDGKGLQMVTEAGFLGFGDSPLIRFLSDTLYMPSLDVLDSARVATYLIKKAVQYIDGCGEPIDVTILRDNAGDYESLPASTISDWIEKMEGQESLLQELITLRPFSSLPT